MPYSSGQHSDLLRRFIAYAEAHFPTATPAERDRLCLDLQLLAESEGLDLDSALGEGNLELLMRIRRHEMQRRIES